MAKDVLRIDLETYSSVDLKKCGVYKYAESEDFEILLFGYAFNDEPASVVDVYSGEPLRARVREALRDPDVLKTAYNANFETVCIRRFYGKDKIDINQWTCTSVHALYLGMPGNLADVTKVIGLSEDKQKLSAGWALIKYFCIPCKPTKINGRRTRNLPHHDPEKWDLFKKYCARDVFVEREVAGRLARFPVPEKEWALWRLDQRMAERGVLLDRGLVESAIEVDDFIRSGLVDEAIALTGLENPNSRNQLIHWLEQELEENVATLTKKDVPRLLKSADDQIVMRVLEIRQELAKTSVSKYRAMNRAMCSDDCVRGLTQFYGANRTGRWAGRIVQVQNLRSNSLPDLDLARRLIFECDDTTTSILFGGVPDVLSQLVRTAFIAREGKILAPVDFSAIEARVIAWLAWCEWRLEVFRTHGKIYEASAEQMFKLPAGSVTKKSPYRQKGKIAELALGYQGGAGALKTMGALEMGILEEELEDIKHTWRNANPEIASMDDLSPGLWKRVEIAAKQAIRNKDTPVVLPIAAGRSKLVFTRESGFLTVQLPSGRKLYYVKARIEKEDLYHQKEDGTKFLIASAGSITYEGLDQKTKRWTRVSTYGGKLVENITQAIARDCLADAMLALDEEGFEQLFTVHDEIVLEIEPGKGQREKAEEIMGRELPWAPGLPLRADGFETVYYMKETD